MSVSLADILTAVKNVVTALNGGPTQYMQQQGSNSTAGITSATVLKSSPGRLCVVSVVVAGSTAGTAYDAVTTSSPSRPLYTIPNTVGVYVVNIPTNYGLTVVPGTGQTVAVSWS